MNEATIFLLEADDDTRPLIKQQLKKNGYKVIVAIDEEDAFERLDEGGVRADVILVNIPNKSVEEMLETGRQIRQQGDLNASVIVIAAKYGEDLEGKDVPAGENDYITYPEDGEQLFALLAGLTPSNVFEARK